MPAYAEFAVTTNFSFLHGASHPEELVKTAHFLRLSGIGIADRNTLAGVVRAYSCLKEIKAHEDDYGPCDLKLFIGCRLVFMDGAPDLVVYPRDRTAYGQLCRLLSEGKHRAGIKGQCHIYLEDFLFRARDFQIAVIPPAKTDAAFTDILKKLAIAAPQSVWLALSMPYQGADRRRAERLARVAAQAGVPLLATNDILYHTAERRNLQDVLTCIHEHTTIDRAGRKLEKNAERHLKSPAEMARLFRDFPQALGETQRFMEPVTFSLDQLKYSYPDEPVPPEKTPQQHLVDLAWQGAASHYGAGSIPQKVADLLEKELRLIGKLGYAPYFLTVHDIVSFARSKDILCQGRGSAANSAVCYCLGITAVDPVESELLFERFISEERKEPPDIDVDFEHERREEVMQYVYERYTHDRAAIVATVICYRPRSAIRDVGKALGLTEDVTVALASTVWGSWGEGLEKRDIQQAGLDPSNLAVLRAVKLATELIGFPRHLSQHVGGFVLTRERLDEMVPIGPAAMDKRYFIEWDKDDIDAVNMMKVDVLSLGMLTCIRKAFGLIERHKGDTWSLATIEPEDQGVYDMLCRGDSLGVFQVESRAQMNMLPRLRPRTFYDLVIEVAIVRPGPIQGNMVHPYLRRRSGAEKIDYPAPSPQYGHKDELKDVLGRTCGVPLFQEQAMRIAIVAAGFSPEEANQLRRAMATFRNVGTIHKMERKMVDGMIARGYKREFAQSCFNQIKGFGEYGFPESHAASFAQLVYASSWIKHYHPDVFAAALLNSQPMGFYAPAQIVRDARDHGVEVRPVDINFSEWDNTLESAGGPYWALRLGFRQLDGFSKKWAEEICKLRGNGYPSIEELRRRTRLDRRAFVTLADADAFGSMQIDRRDALWSVRRLPNDETLPLFKAAETSELARETPVALPVMKPSEHVIADYESSRLSLKGHPMEFLRGKYGRWEVSTCREAANAANNTKIRVAGVVTVRQKPGSAKGVVFMTIEDETGIANIVVWSKLMKIYRKEVMGSRLILIEGTIQRSPEGVVHLVAQKLADRSADLLALSEQLPQSPANDETLHGVPGNAMMRHPRNVRILPKSRDFH
ncbi:MAG: error-prone DNA polymerase [Phyllobacterium sp.]